MFKVKLRAKSENDCSARPGESTSVRLSNIMASNGETEESIPTVSGTLKIEDASTTGGAPVITGVTDGATYTKPVTPIITDDNLDTVELYKDGTIVNGYRSGTRISMVGSYRLVAKDQDNNITEVSFTIEEEQHEDSKAYEVDIKANKPEVEPEQTVKVQVVAKNIKNENGIGTFAAKLTYDDTIFEKITQSNFKAGKDWESITYNENSGKLVTVTATGNQIKSDSIVFELTLKVLKNAKIGETKLILSGINASDGSIDLYVRDIDGTINIVEVGATSPTPTPTPTATAVKPTPTATTVKPTPTDTIVTPTPTATSAKPTPTDTTAGDTTPPIILNVENGKVYNKPVTPLVSDPNLNTVELYKDGIKIEEYKNGDTINKDGYYRLVAKDKAGNTSEVSFIIKMSEGNATPTPGGKDTIPPVITGVDNAGTYDSPVAPRATDDNLYMVELYKGGVKVAGYKNGDTISAVGYYKLIATDKAGNVSSVAFTIVSKTNQQTPTPAKTITTPRPTATGGGNNIDITDRGSLPYAGPNDLILPVLYVIAALGAIAFIQYKRIKNI